jgi:hypothetical protein
MYVSERADALGVVGVRAARGSLPGRELDPSQVPRHFGSGIVDRRTATPENWRSIDAAEGAEVVLAENLPGWTHPRVVKVLRGVSMADL